MMVYFAVKNNLNEFYLKGFFFKRPLIDGLRGVHGFFAGDVFEVFFFKQGQFFSFEGLCLSVRGKHFYDPETSFMLRNVIQSVAVEGVFSFYYNRVYYVQYKDFKKKDLVHPRSRYYFLRGIFAKYTKVK